jgi:RNA polymerase sigma factor (sigma-70 family)
MSESDDTLVRRFQHGDEDAFTAIYHRYAGLLRWNAWKLCGDWHFAEDICNEVWLTAWKYIPHGTMYKLDSYLVLLVKQRWWLVLNQLQRRPETPLDVYNIYRTNVSYVEDVVIERETLCEIEQLLSYLPHAERQVATLKLLAGYDLRGAAAALGCSVSLSRALWRRCTRKFTAWAGTKQHYAALDQALILAREPAAVPIESQCKVPGCGRERHAYERCEYHAENMLARRRGLAAKRCTVSTSA